MIFPKQFLAESVERKALQQSYQTSPYETTYKNGDKSPFDLVMMNYYTFFDAKSSEMKELVRSARKEITQKCFLEEDMNTIPNGERIQECIKRINHKVYGKHFDMRNVYYGNILYNYEKDMKNIPESNITDEKMKKQIEITERLLWDSFKSKYYFSEKFAI